MDVLLTQGISFKECKKKIEGYFATKSTYRFFKSMYRLRVLKGIFQLYFVGSPYYDNVRPLSYPDADAVLICFDISRPETLDSVLRKVGTVCHDQHNLHSFMDLVVDSKLFMPQLSQSRTVAPIDFLTRLGFVLLGQVGL